MAYSRVEQAYIDGVADYQFPDPVIEEPAQEQPMMLADSGKVKSDAQPGFGTIGPIPRNKAQEALGYVGELLTKAGVQLDKVGLDVPILGRITLKDLTVGESGRVLEDMSYGFMPVEGAGGFISGTTRIKPDEALELLNIAPVVGAAAKVGGKAVTKGITQAVEATKGLPVGMSVKPVGQGVDELGFYSAATKAVDNIQQPKGTGAQFLAQIEKTTGVKPEEIKWTGLDDFLKSKKSVTKQEVQEYLAANRVEVKEVQLGDIKINEKSEYALPEVLNVIRENQGTDFDRIRLALVNDYDAYQALTKKFPNLEDTDNWGDRVLQDIIGASDGGGPKFSKYTLPGGENYREILLTLPFKEPAMPKGYQVSKMEYDDGTVRFFAETPTTRSSAYKTEAEANAELQKMTEGLKGFRKNLTAFKSSHFDQPNILAHLRVNDRVDVDGKKVLFVEEVQSDWHQAGRKKGYQNPEVQKQIDDIQSQMNAMAEIRDPVTNQMVNEKEWFALGRKKDELAKQIGDVPDAPFKANWYELALKRAIQMAAEGGYDRIAFTTGAQQAARYDLSKQVKGLIYKQNDDGTYKVSAIMPDGPTRPLGWDIQAEKLDEFVGKDVAKKIIASEGNEVNLGGPGSASQPKDMWKGLSGIDLKIGGEGMAGFYDNIVPKFLDKYGKKWDAKTGMTKIRVATDKQAAEDANLLNELGVSRDGPNAMANVHYIDITPKMKESVLTQGQPLFAIGAGGAGAAMQQEEKK